MPTTENAETIKLLEAGLCPGWTKWIGNYNTERGRKACGRKANRLELCGIHDNARRQEEADKRREMDRQARESARRRSNDVAVNLAIMLSDRAPVIFSSNDECMITLDQESARRLLDHFNR